MFFTEDFIHYIWKFRLFDRDNLQTTAGESIEVFSAGLPNSDSGPDFHNARLRIGDTTWAGNVELHINSSDWHKHKHTHDGAYKNVILHVVYRDDEPIVLPDGRQLATLELKDRISPDLYNRYHGLVFGNQQFVPCEGTIRHVDDITLRNWLTRVLVERLEKRSAAVMAALEKNKGDWEETFYQFLAAQFGFKTNALPFELLAKSLPQITLSKHKNNPLQVEALIFGQAGFLEGEWKDEYPQKLQEEYAFLRKKYNLAPVEKHLWKFMRMRPQNFPTIRLAQFAALIVKSNHLFSKMIDIKDVTHLRKLFTDLEVNPYWETHYRFDAESRASSKSLGESSIDILLLNTFVLILFSYGKHNQQEYYVNRSLKLLEKLPAEENNIVTNFGLLGIKVNTAFDSQALLELKNNYCSYKKCLQCGVGNKILRMA
ncbi:DUF2851 family protein [Mucilaginibacter ginsenosidivorans]|uniref:DUF2851 family protein n=1 Tax=Mucilaginibacter ginsenosidivorans TaxID=398053 RepID=A0A5B8UX39_9SPHI|nr:DUF2851 family protein [Mucilaginibacter ginsenosidivorans]QEC63499.1 DUF2851 family protein [Mucilaginibacter ginsenosidivorans]